MSLSPGAEICQGTICAGLGAGGQLIGASLMQDMGDAAVVLGFIIAAHGVWRIVCRCVALWRVHGWRAIYKTENVYESPYNDS